MFELRCSKFELFCSESAGQPQDQRDGGLCATRARRSCAQVSLQLTGGSGFAKTPSVISSKIEGQTILGLVYGDGKSATRNQVVNAG